MTREIDQFIKEYSKAIIDKNAAIFAGAGLSVSAGFVNWRELVEVLAEDLGLDIDEESDLVAIAQYHFNEQERSKINTIIIEQFSKKLGVTENNKLLSDLPIDTYWTTNYDTLIEDALFMAGKTVDIKRRVDDFSILLSKRDAIVYKMHGDVSEPSKAIITKDDYETYNDYRNLFTMALQNDLATKIFLFIGFSFEDPNLSYILSRIRALMSTNKVKHYCFFKKLTKRINESEKNFLNRELSQELKLKDLKRYNIKPLMIDDYSEITTVLKKIEKHIKANNVFVSGSIQYYDIWSREKVDEFVYKLSYALSKNGRKIISGLGFGIGDPLIHGVVKRMYETNYRHLEEYAILRPHSFAFNVRQKEVMYLDYRKEMICQANVAIFVFGNKISSSNEKFHSLGVEAEFDVAIENGLIPIPIGATGYRALDLWKLVRANIEVYMPQSKFDPSIRQIFKKLGDSSLDIDELISLTLTLISKNTKMI